MGPIGEKIRALRELKGDTQSELAEKAGLSQSQISDIEKSVDANTEKIRAICRAYKIKPFELIADPGDLENFLPSYITKTDAKILRILNVKMSEEKRSLVLNIMRDALKLAVGDIIDS